jgi:peptidoglycan hydrolase-like protein with peptidoglycan-binding domain
VPHDLSSCTIIFGEGTPEEERMLVSLGRLDPADTVEGMQARLRNLGFYGGEIDGVAGPRTKAAAAAFAAAHQVSEAPGTAGFAARLASIHGN